MLPREVSGGVAPPDHRCHAISRSYWSVSLVCLARSAANDGCKEGAFSSLSSVRCRKYSLDIDSLNSLCCHRSIPRNIHSLKRRSFLYFHVNVNEKEVVGNPCLLLIPVRHVLMKVHDQNTRITHDRSTREPRAWLRLVMSSSACTRGAALTVFRNEMKHVAGLSEMDMAARRTPIASLRSVLSPDEV